MGRYFHRRWNESRGDDYDSWGGADYFFATDDDLVPTRQVEVCDAGQRLLYDSSHPEDEFGGIGVGPVFRESENGPDFEISATAFESVWVQGRRA